MKVVITLSTLYIILELLERYHKRRILTVEDLKIGKKKFVILVLQWCINNIENNHIPFYLRIIYRIPTKRLGYYQFWNKEITIFIDDSIYLYELVDTAIHEFIHHCQLPSKKFEKEYSDKLISHGYYNHPMEREARNLAKKYRNQCYDEIISKVV